MDRDRDRDRRPFPRDVPPEDRYGLGGGQSYRPGASNRDRSPPARNDPYRAGRSPPRGGYVDSYAPGRPVGRRSRSPPPPRGDNYRRRNPSPRFRENRDSTRGGDSYRARPRSPAPVRREDLPRDDLFRREPIRGAREPRDDRDSHRDERALYRDDREDHRVDHRAYNARSPPRYRDRSPMPMLAKRGREASPVPSRGRRTPPPAKRERIASPPRGRYDDYLQSREMSPPRRGYTPPPKERRFSPSARGPTRDYRPRSRSPVGRSERIDPRAVDDWRRPISPSPPRQREYYMDDAGKDSAATSRRSSGPLHPSRLALQQSMADDRSGRPSSREAYGESRTLYRTRSPPSQRPSPPRQPEYEFAEGVANGDDRTAAAREPPRTDYVPPPRAPPTGPGGSRPGMAPPSGPAGGSAPVSSLGSSRAHAAPLGPRGDAPPRGGIAPRGRGSFRGDFGNAEFPYRGRGGFGGFRGGRGAGPSPGLGRGSGFEQREAEAPVPIGPRGGFPQSQPTAAPYRQNSVSTSAAYSRSQRFAPNGAPVQDLPTGPRAGAMPHNPRRTASAVFTPTGAAPSVPSAASHDRQANSVHPALADLPKIREGGQRMEPQFDRSRLEKLEEEKERLWRAIEEKEQKKRKNLREWDRMKREAETAALRSELAEESLRGLADEGGGEMAAF